MKPELAQINISLKERKKAIHSVSKIKNNFDSLLGNLYTLVDKKIINEEVCRYRTALKADCEIFKVHFPSMPITPGSCILDMAKELVEDFLAMKMSLKEVNNIRFYDPISPATDSEIDFYFEKEEPATEKDIENFLHRIYLVLRKKDTLQDEGILAEMHLVLTEKNSSIV